MIKEISKSHIYSDVNLQHLATHTAGFRAIDLLHFYNQACLNLSSKIILRYPNYIELKKQLSDAGTAITADDFEDALDICRKSQSDLIGAPKIPNVQWFFKLISGKILVAYHM